MTDLKKLIKEELTKTDVKDEINKAFNSADNKKKIINSSEFKRKVEQIVKTQLKNSPELEKEMVEISKNVLTQLYKALWVKKAFWTSQLSNKSN